MYEACLTGDFTSLSASKKESALNEMLKKDIPKYKEQFYFEEGLHVNTFKAAFWKRVKKELHIHVHHTNIIRNYHIQHTNHN